MSYTTILAELKTDLDSVSGIGKVYDYFRASDDLEKARETFQKGRIFHVWMISRFAVDPSDAGTSGLSYRNHEFDLWGYYQIDDSEKSEKTFQALCDTVMDTFDTTANLQPTADSAMVEAAALLSFDQVLFAGVLCHRARIRLVVNEEVSN